MSFLIDNILKDKTCKSGKKLDETKTTENYKSFHSENNISILENSLRNRHLYSSVLTQYGYSSSLTSPVYKQFTDYYNNDVKYSYIDKYYNRFNYNTPYPSIYLNNQILNKARKGGQIRFTLNQTEELEKHFNSHKYLSPEDRKQLAALLCLSDRQVKTWFQNRRAKWRKCNNITELTNKEEYSVNNQNNDYLYLRR